MTRRQRRRRARRSSVICGYCNGLAASARLTSYIVTPGAKGDDEAYHAAWLGGFAEGLRIIGRPSSLLDRAPYDHDPLAARLAQL